MLLQFLIVAISLSIGGGMAMECSTSDPAVESSEYTPLTFCLEGKRISISDQEVEGNLLAESFDSARIDYDCIHHSSAVVPASYPAATTVTSESADASGHTLPASLARLYAHDYDDVSFCVFTECFLAPGSGVSSRGLFGRFFRRGGDIGLTPDDIARHLDGVTDTSTEIARQIRKGMIDVNIVSDARYAEVIGDASVASLRKADGSIWLRASRGRRAITDAVHEGKHALDWNSRFFQGTARGFRPRVDMTTYMLEDAAYMQERLFRRAMKGKTGDSVLGRAFDWLHVRTSYWNKVEW